MSQLLLHSAVCACRRGGKFLRWGEEGALGVCRRAGNAVSGIGNERESAAEPLAVLIPAGCANAHGWHQARRGLLQAALPPQTQQRAAGRAAATWKNTRWCHGFSYFFMPLTGSSAFPLLCGCAHPPPSQGSQGNTDRQEKKGFTYCTTR